MPSSVMVPGIGVLQRGDGAHERTLAGAVRTEQAEHVIADCKGDDS